LRIYFQGGHWPIIRLLSYFVIFVRLSQAYRPSTHSAHRTAVTALAMFCTYYDVSFPAIGIHTLLSFIEFLINSNLSVPTVKNYVSSIKSFFKANSLPSEVFISHHLTLALASLSKNYSPPTSIKLIFTPQQFFQLIVASSHLPLHVIYKMAFI
jgi:site-specific recombinase XerD